MPGQSFRGDMQRLFDQFWNRGGFPSLPGLFDAEPFWRNPSAAGFAAPAVDVAEDDKAYHITAELPGMGEKDIEVNLSGDTLTIKGEKRDEKEEKAKSYYVSERHYGSFQRSFTLPEGIDRDKTDASFSAGVLTLTLPKTAEAVKQQKKIEVKPKFACAGRWPRVIAPALSEDAAARAERAAGRGENSMALPIHVIFRGMGPSDAIEARIRQRAEELAQFYDRIVDCRVVESGAHHHEHGRIHHLRIISPSRQRDRRQSRSFATLRA
jgi:HSP20 family protein